MPSNTPKLAEIKRSEKDVILAKATLRTEMFAEKFYPPTKPDTRSDAVKALEANVFDNPKHPLYGNTQAVQILATMQDIPAEEQKFQHRKNDAALEFARAVVVVPVNSPWYEWPEKGDIKPNTTYIVTHQGKGAAKDAECNKVFLKGYGYQFRPATEAEMVAVIDGLMAVQPAKFIKNLGDALEGVDLDE
jgi:hypothetical protein